MVVQVRIAVLEEWVLRHVIIQFQFLLRQMVDQVDVLAVHLNDLCGLRSDIFEIGKGLGLHGFLKLNLVSHRRNVLLTSFKRVDWKEAGVGRLLHFHLILAILRLLSRSLIPLLAES